jgi:hypothetical protein
MRNLIKIVEIRRSIINLHTIDSSSFEDNAFSQSHPNNGSDKFTAHPEYALVTGCDMEPKLVEDHVVNRLTK